MADRDLVSLSLLSLLSAGVCSTYRSHPLTLLEVRPPSRYHGVLLGASYALPVGTKCSWVLPLFVLRTIICLLHSASGISLVPQNPVIARRR